VSRTAVGAAGEPAVARRRPLLLLTLCVFAGAAIGLSLHFILHVGWVWVLVVAPVAIALLGLVVQALGILSREEP